MTSNFKHSKPLNNTQKPYTSIKTQNKKMGAPSSITRFVPVQQYQQIIGNQKFGQQLKEQSVLENQSNCTFFNHGTTGIVQRNLNDALIYLEQEKMIDDINVVPQKISDIIYFLKNLSFLDEHYFPLKNRLLNNLEDNEKEEIEAELQTLNGSKWRIFSQQDFSDSDDTDEDFILETVLNKPIRKYHSKKAKLEELKDGKIKTMFKHKNKLRGIQNRSKEYGNVTIVNQVINHISKGELERPIEVEGFIEPTETKGRPNAPEPSSNYQVHVDFNKIGTKPNTGIIDAQKGHIMALELGGPDISRNIVPQWANWQANGIWRQAEKEALKRAKIAIARKNKLWFHVLVRYKDYYSLELSSHRGFSVPTGFKMIVQEKTADGTDVFSPEVLFDDEQAQNHTDQELAFRTFDKIDEQEADT